MSSTHIRAGGGWVSRCARDQGREPLNEGDLLVAIEGTSVGQDLNPHVICPTVDVGDRIMGNSWMNTAVFSRNIGISGTFSTTITAAATLRANWLLSANAPAGAYTSIIGTAVVLFSSPSHIRSAKARNPEY